MNRIKSAREWTAKFKLDEITVGYPLSHIFEEKNRSYELALKISRRIMGKFCAAIVIDFDDVDAAYFEGSNLVLVFSDSGDKDYKKIGEYLDETWVDTVSDTLMQSILVEKNKRKNLYADTVIQVAGIKIDAEINDFIRFHFDRYNSGQKIKITGKYDVEKLLENFQEIHKFSENSQQDKFSGVIMLSEDEVSYKTHSGHGYYTFYSDGTFEVEGSPQSLLDGSKFAKIEIPDSQWFQEEFRKAASPFAYIPEHFARPIY